MKRAATHGEESLNAFAVIVIGIDFTKCMQARGYTVRKGAQHMIAAIYARKSPEQDTTAGGGSGADRGTAPAAPSDGTRTLCPVLVHRPDEAAEDLAGARQCNERGELTMDKREQLEFREHHTSGYPWQLQAWLSQVIIGHIRRGGDGVYHYYHGELNELNADLSDTDLDRLKEKIQARGRR